LFALCGKTKQIMVVTKSRISMFSAHAPSSSRSIANQDELSFSCHSRSSSVLQEGPQPTATKSMKLCEHTMADPWQGCEKVTSTKVPGCATGSNVWGWSFQNCAWKQAASMLLSLHHGLAAAKRIRLFFLHFSDFMLWTDSQICLFSFLAQCGKPHHSLLFPSCFFWSQELWACHLIASLHWHIAEWQHTMHCHPGETWTQSGNMFTTRIHKAQHLTFALNVMTEMGKQSLGCVHLPPKEALAHPWDELNTHLSHRSRHFRFL